MTLPALADFVPSVQQIVSGRFFVCLILGIAIVLGAAARICEYLMDRYVQRFWRRVETIKPIRLVIVGRKVH